MKQQAKARAAYDQHEASRVDETQEDAYANVTLTLRGDLLVEQTGDNEWRVIIPGVRMSRAMIDKAVELATEAMPDAHPAEIDILTDTVLDVIHQHNATKLLGRYVQPR